jgi:hypothetical protein
MISGADVSEIEGWWHTEEAPRLLWAFFRYVRKTNGRFCRYGFIQYLHHNVRKRYAAVNYLRAKGWPLGRCVPIESSGLLG